MPLPHHPISHHPISHPPLALKHLTRKQWVMKYQAPKQKQCGVTLLETAIVLGIIGVLIGALFAASGIATYRANINQASDELNEISQNMQSLYAGQNTSYINLGPLSLLPTDFTTLTPKLVSQGVFPQEMISGVGANTPWGTPVQVGLSGSATTPVEFVVRYNGISAESCADLLTRNSMPGRDTGLTMIMVNGAIVGIGANSISPPPDLTKPLPMTSIAAAAACSGSAPYIIDWYFNLST